MDESITDRLHEIQQGLDAPKGQWNDFSKYHYRSCEDILEGVKPLLKGLTLTLSDDIIMVGDRVYVKATVTLSNGTDSVFTTAMAREALVKKGMDESQITGAASSYARKYALNGLFCIDDEKDADSKDNNQKSPQKKQAQKQEDDNKPWYNEPNYQADLLGMTDAIRNGASVQSVIEQISQKYKVSNKYRDMIKAI